MSSWSDFVKNNSLSIDISNSGEFAGMNINPNGEYLSKTDLKEFFDLQVLVLKKQIKKMGGWANEEEYLKLAELCGRLGFAKELLEGLK